MMSIISYDLAEISRYYSPIFMGNEECALNFTTIWIFTFAIEHFLVFIEIIQIDSSIECEKNDLWCL